MDNNITFGAIPGALHWHNPPSSWSIEGGQVLSITAGQLTDLFVDPNGQSVVTNSPRLVFHPPLGDFLLRSRVTVGFASRFDAGVLLVYTHERQWAKLCFEFSPQRRPTIVSVVTQGTSDDCNSMTMDGDQTWLRLARIGDAFALHTSGDGRFWNLIRYFTLGQMADPVVGFSAQSPTGESCTVTFDQIRFESRRLNDLRSGE